MIYQVTSCLLIPQIVELAKDVPGTPLDALRETLVNSISRKDARIFVDEKEGKIRGFIFATVEELEGKDALFIQFCVVRPTQNEGNICNELLARVRKWGQESELRTMYFMTARNPKAFARKYHFRFHATVLKRSLDYERTF